MGLVQRTSDKTRHTTETRNIRYTRVWEPQTFCSRATPQHRHKHNTNTPQTNAQAQHSPINTQFPRLRQQKTVRACDAPHARHGCCMAPGAHAHRRAGILRGLRFTPGDQWQLTRTRMQTHTSMKFRSSSRSMAVRVNRT